jgi:hypothetical protein
MWKTNLHIQYQHNRKALEVTANSSIVGLEFSLQIYTELSGNTCVFGVFSWAVKSMS